MDYFAFSLILFFLGAVILHHFLVIDLVDVGLDDVFTLLAKARFKDLEGI